MDERKQQIDKAEKKQWETCKQRVLRRVDLWPPKI